MADKNKFVDKELERGFISCVLNNSEVFDDVVERVNINDFHIKVHKKIFKKIQQQYSETGGISKVKIMQFVNENISKDKMEQILDTDYVVPMEISSIVDELNKYRFKRIVRNSLKKSYNYLIKKGVEIDALRSKIQDEIFEATSEEIGKNLIYDIEDVALESFERLVERQEGNAAEKIRTGIRSLDGMLNGGFSKKHLSILAGRPSMGKTAMATKILSSILRTTDVPCLFVSLEMDRVKLLDRMLIQKSKVASDDFYNTGKDEVKAITEKQRNSIEYARNWIHDKPLKIADKRGLTIEDIKSITRKTDNLFDGELGIIFIDYLQEIKMEAKGGRFDKGAAEAIRELRNLAGELDLHVLLLHQINRDFKNRSNKRPLMSDLRDTGEAEEKMDNGLFLHRPAYYKSKKEGESEPLVQSDAELNIAKQREGKTGPIYFTWYPEILYFQGLHDYKINGEINYLKQEG